MQHFKKTTFLHLNAKKNDAYENNSEEGAGRAQIEQCPMVLEQCGIRLQSAQPAQTVPREGSVRTPRPSRITRRATTYSWCKSALCAGLTTPCDRHWPWSAELFTDRPWSAEPFVNGLWKAELDGNGPGERLNAQPAMDTR